MGRLVVKMPQKKQLTVEQRAAICTLREEGYSMRDTAKKLGVSLKGVHYTLCRKRDTGALSDRKRSGRPRATTSAEDTFIITISKRNRRLTAPEIARQLNEGRQKKVSVTTVKTRLLAAGLRGCVAAKKPLLRPVHKRKRRVWAREHQNWSTDDWNKVLWTDESKFEIMSSKRRVFVRRRPEECLAPQCVVPTVKHGGGSVMVWGCFAGTSVGDLVKIDGVMRKEQYLDILRNHAIPSGHRIVGQELIFQHDNDPKHSARICKAYLEEREAAGELKTMVWPPQSPDISPIEHLWDELDRKAKERQPQNADQLWQFLQDAWQEITADYLKKLILRLPKICKAVIRAKGGHIDENKL